MNRHTISEPTRRAVAGLVLTVFYVASIFNLLSAGWSWRCSVAAVAWPRVVGTIEAVRWADRGSGKTSVRRIAVRYAYAVDGVDHEGRRLAFGFYGNIRKSAQRKIATRLRNARSVAVRYDPSSPRRSTLSVGLHEGIGLRFAMSCAILAATAAMHRLLRRGHRDRLFVVGVVVAVICVGAYVAIFLGGAEVLRAGLITE
ncbi:MAG: DUF3592 domain-containing protein [Planctomycetota bacterium]